ncbi:PREDICTED: CSC1-like protein At1g69450 isoform X1 [Populus euphratica]|uniref:CSC1-like protein At1g69450 isoform X1 n=1 Tax=Populus euphratica TaxID=75702 RepID=A0AAJ6TVU2_POPEU|nr:PREDICTED: CSC1-like protein At1g69450 isoform X1 [Populus euphratica]
MLVSAILTSVGINSALCVIFLVLYSILKKQPSYYEVYIPRLLTEGNSKRRSRFNLERLIPSTGWLPKAWKLSEEEMLSSSGLDAVVYMRTITFCLKVFSFAGIIGIFILLPVNCSGTELHQIDFEDLYSNSLDVFTISNVNRGSKWLWIHFSSVYAITIFICYLLYHEYKYISSKRIAYFYSSKPQPHQFTILVRNIPVSAGSSVSDSVQSFFTEYYPATYLSHIVVRRTSKVQSLINDAKQLYRRLLHLQSEPSEQKSKQVGLFEKNVDLLDHYGKRLEDLEQNARLEQSEVSLAKDTHAAFVSFKTRYGASTVFHLQQSTNPTHWLTEEAPQPNDVFWPFFSSSFMGRWISKLLVVVACILLTVVFLIPVVVVQGLTNLSQLEVWFPFLKSILTIAFVSQIVTGYLPSLILMLFLKIVPPIMEFLSSIQGYISHSEIERSACNKVLWFTVWNIFFATVFSGSVLNKLSIILDPKNIPAKLAVVVPAQASFFIAYVVTSGWTSTSSELFRIIPLICSLMTKCCAESADDEIEVPSIPYHRDIPRILFFGLLGIAYFFLAPVILPFLLVYFCLAYIIFRNQFINVYAPKYETAGKFWPIVHNLVIFSLVLMHAIAVGIFSLKKLSLASTLVLPLPVLTLLFNEYCRKRFRPIFTAYPAEILIKKDREDQNDATMSEFFDKLATTYQDPALMPIQYSADCDSLNRPLLSSSETSM